MIPRTHFKILSLAVALAATLTARAAPHDLYLCAAFNNGSRVLGSKDGSTSR